VTKIARVELVESLIDSVSNFEKWREPKVPVENKLF
jgi:hypothetical protein